MDDNISQNMNVMMTTIMTIITFNKNALSLGIHIHCIVIFRPVELTELLLRSVQLGLS